MNFGFINISEIKKYNIINYLKNIFIFLMLFFAFYFYQSFILKTNNLLSLIINILGFIIFIISTVNAKSGLYFFIFLTPLLNSLPIILHANDISIILFLFFYLFLGFIINYISSNFSRNLSIQKKNDIFDQQLKQPAILLLFIILISAIITIWRYSNFIPLITRDYHNLKVNLLGFRSTDAIYWTIKYFFNYTTWFGLILIIYNVIKSKKDFLNVLYCLVVSVIFTYVIFFYQYFVNPAFGNLEMWVIAKRFNSTFTDPNSLGNFIILIFPILVSFIIYFNKWYLKLISIIILILLIIVLFFSGSRNALLGVFIASMIFIIIFISRSFIRLKNKLNKKIGIGKTILILVLICLCVITSVISPFFLIDKNRNLKEIDKPITNISLIDRFISTIWMSYNTFIQAGFKEAFKSVSSFRYALWNQAKEMALDFPLTGVGVGSFIIELPNYYEKNNSDVREIDYAGNYYLQIVSELGIPCLILILFIFYIIFKKILVYFVQNRRLHSFKKEDWLFKGLSVSFLSMFLLFFLGSHTNFFEILFIFSLIIGLIIIYPNFQQLEYKEEFQIFLENINENKKINLLRIIAFFFILIIFSVNFLYISFNKISITNNQNLYNIDNHFGFSSPDKIDGKNIRWIGLEAGITMERLGNKLIIPFKDTNPDIAKYPLEMKIFIDNHLIKKLEINDNTWHESVITIPESENKYLSIVFILNRTLNSVNYGYDKNKELCIALGAIKYLGEKNE